LNKLFNVIAILGLLVIGILSFVVPDNPWIIIPSLSAFLFDKPLWLGLIVNFSFFYIMFLMMLYDILEQRG